MLAFSKTPNTLILQFIGRTVMLPLSSPAAEKALELLTKKASDADIMAAVDPLIGIRNHASGKFQINDSGEVFIGATKLPLTLAGRLIDFAEHALLDQADSLVKFWSNCLLNPDKRAQSDLYAFLEHNGIPITSDGCFIAYRSVVRNDQGKLVDARTGTFDNSVGSVVKMDRSKCNSDPNQTCSEGLHVAALEYAKGFAKVLLEVKVNPKDVVAIPVDYNGQKMRVCEFQVMAINAESAQDGKAITRPLYDPQTAVAATGGDNGAWKGQKRDSRGRFLPKV